MNHSGGPNVMSCEQCMLSSCLTPQYNVYSFVVLKRPPYLMVPVIVTIYWYYNYGLAVLKQLQYLMQSGRIVGLLILGNSALIIITTVTVTITITVPVTVAAISLTQQVHTAQYVEKSYFRCLEQLRYWFRFRETS